MSCQGTPMMPAKKTSAAGPGRLVLSRQIHEQAGSGPRLVREVVDGQARQPLDVAADAVEEVDAEAPLLIPAAEIERVRLRSSWKRRIAAADRRRGLAASRRRRLDRVARPAARVCWDSLGKPRSLCGSVKIAVVIAAALAGEPGDAAVEGRAIVLVGEHDHRDQRVRPEECSALLREPAGSAALTIASLPCLTTSWRRIRIDQEAVPSFERCLETAADFTGPRDLRAGSS